MCDFTPRHSPFFLSGLPYRQLSGRLCFIGRRNWQLGVEYNRFADRGVANEAPDEAFSRYFIVVGC